MYKFLLILPFEFQNTCNKTKILPQILLISKIAALLLKKILNVFFIVQILLTIFIFSQLLLFVVIGFLFQRKIQISVQRQQQNNDNQQQHIPSLSILGNIHVLLIDSQCKQNRGKYCKSKP